MSKIDNFTVKEGNVGKLLQRTLFDEAGDEINITTGGGAALFNMKKVSDGSMKISDAAVTVVNGASGIIAYPFTAGDLDTPADYVGWFVYTNGAGKITTYPTGSGLAGWIAIEVVPN